jgi:hypothetical protein
MMRDFHLTKRAALLTPLAEAIALFNWHRESNPWGSPGRASDGYVTQEKHRILRGWGYRS